MKIDKINFCDTDNGATLDLLVIVVSSADHFQARQAIRKTWGQFAVERGAYLLFLLGSTEDNQIQTKIIEEDKQHNDILQGQFNDHYYNLTLKTISMMKWISENCQNVKWVLKVDDDMFVNMQFIADFSETRTISNVIIGMFIYFNILKSHYNHTDKSQSRKYLSTFMDTTHFFV